jgi:phage shock protein C
MEKKLYRDEFHQKIGGVCAGLAEYLDADVTLIRILFVIFAFVSVGFIAYIILWIVLPKKGFPFNSFGNPTVDYTVPPQQQYTAPQANPFAGTSFGSNEPVPVMPPQKSHAGIIFGAVLILIGGLVLMSNYDLVPDIDFSDAWPVILIFVGAALIVSGQAQQAWQKTNWNKKDNSPDADSSVAGGGTPMADHNSTLES